MLPSVFECGNAKCAYAIASDSLNALQLKILRSGAPKTCPKCGKSTSWLEQMPLINTKTINADHGGSKHETINSPIRAIPKSASQKLRAARYSGSH